MNRTLIFLPLLIVATRPASAQLTAEQRAAQTQRVERTLAANNGWPSALTAGWERRALEGDPTAYFGPAGLAERRASNDRLARSRAQALYPNSIISPAQLWGSDRPVGSMWMAIGMRSGTPTRLRRADGQQFDARAEIPLRLTIASPIGTPEKALMIRASLQKDPASAEWSMMREVEADPEGNYRLDVPSLAAGDWRLSVDVFDPEHPESPYSTTRSTVLVRTP